MSKLIALAFVLLGGATFWTATAPAAPTAAAQPRTDILQLVGQTAIIEPDSDLLVRVRVVGAPAGARLHAEVHTRVPTRSDFNAVLGGREPRGRIGSVFEVPAAPDAAGTVLITIGTRDPQSQLPVDATHVRLGEGVYPITIDLLSSGGANLDSLLTFMVRLPTNREFGPLGVAIVLPLGGPPAVQSDGHIALDQATAASMLSTASVLEANATIPLTATPVGETLDALEAATVDELRRGAANRQLSLTPYARVSPADWLAAGLGGELEQQFQRGSGTVRTKLAAPDTTTYVGDNRLTPDAVRALQQRGVTRVVVSDDGVSALDSRLFNRTLTQPFNLREIDGVLVAAADTALGAHAGSTGDPALDANHFLADLAVLFFDDPPDKRAVVVALPPSQRVDPQFLDGVLRGLNPTTNRIMQPMTLNTLFSSVPRAGSRGETNGRGTPLTRSLTPVGGLDLSSYASELRSVEGDVNSFREMAGDDNSRVDDLNRRLLVSGAEDLTDSDRRAHLDGLRATIRTELAKVEPPQRQTINFTARDGVVSLTVRNVTGYPVRVRLQLAGEKLEFPGHDSGTVDVTLVEETTRIPLNVRTRASGDSPLDVTLTTPDGNLTVGRTRITVRSTAFSGVGIILSFGSGTFLALWWLRHAIAARRHRARERHAGA